MNRSKDSIKKQVIQFFNAFTTLTAEEEHAIAESMEIKTFKKGEILLKEEDVSTTCYFIVKGCMRQYYMIDGEEKTTAFFTENQAVFFQESCENNTPTGFYLSCTEDCITLIGNEEKEMDLYDQFPRFAIISKLILEKGLGEQQKWQSSFITHTPEQRYLNLLKDKPELIQRVPQYQIASYIGIKPESLSRIRKRLVSNASKKTTH